MHLRSLLFSIPILLSNLTWSAQWLVGPGQTYTAPSQVAGLVASGDTVNIMAGTYPSDVTNWTAHDLVIRGVGGLAHMESNGLAWGDKAIWVIQGDRTTVEWIGFHDCAVPDHNGAGIRQEGRHLKVRHCLFRDNENGILANAVAPSTILIEYSEFDQNGFGDGFSHNLYINQVDSLIFRYNYSHHAFEGHELKSRAHVNLIEYNWIGNEALGEASREVDLPNGGQAYLIGNVVQQGILSQNSNLVGFGLESLDNPGPHEFYAINNTLVNERNNGTFFSVANGTALFKGYNNILAGVGFFMASNGTANVDTLANLRSASIASVEFLDAASYNYHLTSSSPARNIGFPAGVANSGYPLVALFEYVHPTDGVLRCQHALLDAGAFETCTTGLDDVAGSAFALFPNPAQDRLSIMLPSDMVVLSIELIDAQGRVVQRTAGRTSERVDVDISGLAPGHITARVSTSGGVWQRGFVKVR